jgi:hypothetical protein
MLNRGTSPSNTPQLEQAVYDKVLIRLDGYQLDSTQFLEFMLDNKVYIFGSFPISITHLYVCPNNLNLYVNQFKADQLVNFLVGKGYSQPKKLGREGTKATGSYKEDSGQPVGAGTSG